MGYVVMVLGCEPSENTLIKGLSILERETVPGSRGPLLKVSIDLQHVVSLLQSSASPLFKQGCYKSFLVPRKLFQWACNIHRGTLL